MGKAKIISIINYKGGVGKTVSAFNIAAGLNFLNQNSVLLIDLDPQCSLSTICMRAYSKTKGEHIRFSSLKEEETIEKHKDRINHIKKIGSSIKACYIASGLGEISYRMSQGTKEWDTCAFQIIVEEAGGLVLKPDKTPITYNRVDVYNREGYIIINRIENFLF